MKHAMILALITLSACSPKVVRHEVPVVVSRPVTVGCALPRPAKPAPLPDDWASLDVKQKSAAVGKYALDWRGYGEQLNAATAACKEN